MVKIYKFKDFLKIKKISCKFNNIKRKKNVYGLIDFLVNNWKIYKIYHIK